MPKTKIEYLEESLKLFGFQIGDDSKANVKYRTFAIPQSYDGAITIQAGGIYGTYVDLEGIAKNEIELITRYREMSLQPECDNAIDDVVNEAIVVEERQAPVKINLEKIPDQKNGGFSNSTKEIFVNEFKNILRLLRFHQKGHDIFRRWYIDGKVYYHIMIDEKNPQNGIQDLRFIDPRRIRKVREIKKKLDVENGIEVIESEAEYFIYNERGINNTQSTAVQGIKLAPDTICYVPSGLIDSTRNQVLSYLHQAIKPLNQLRMMEDALVIYRLSRAPERRMFYIDVGQLPKLKAEQYIKDVMNRYRNKLVYNPNTGEVTDDKRFMSIMEDYWLPRREGQKTTEVDTLQGGQNLGEITDVNFFQEKLYRALKVPVSRLKSEGGFNLGKESEISRDEIKFEKFVKRIRANFNELFNILLRIQLLLKGIILKEDWEKIADGIYYEYLEDSYFLAAKQAEIRQAKVEEISAIYPFVGIFFSQEYVHKEILNRTDDDIKKIMEQIKQEKTLVPDQMESEVQVQKKIMDFQGKQQQDIMTQQAEIQQDTTNQQARLQAQQMGQQQELTKTKMQHDLIKTELQKVKNQTPQPKTVPTKSNKNIK